MFNPISFIPFSWKHFISTAFLSAEIVTVISGFVTPVNDCGSVVTLLFASTAITTISFFPFKISISNSIFFLSSSETSTLISSSSFHLYVT